VRRRARPLLTRIKALAVYYLFVRSNVPFGLLGLQGAFTHQDFAGHKGTIRAGDVQVNLISLIAAAAMIHHSLIGL
jgi:hypothetical protein